MAFFLSAQVTTPKKNPLFKERQPVRRKKAARALVTQEFREAVRDLLQANQHQLGKWLREVAEGSPEFGRAPDPAQALALLAKLAEFAAPKLGRIEHTGMDGGAMRQVTTIELEFVEAHAPAYVAPQLPLNGHDGSDDRRTIEAAP